jgi:uncharacterized protein YhfF
MTQAHPPSAVDAFWRSYLQSLRADDPAHGMQQPTAWGFGDSAAMADELGELVSQGTKTATCSLLWEYEVEDRPVPQVGELNIVIDGSGNPRCIIETVAVEIKPYNAVEAPFAYAEGEGDRSLAYWRDAHWRYFSRVCAKIGRTPDEAMPLVCERFRVVWRVPVG